MTPEQEILADHIERSGELEATLVISSGEIAPLLPITVYPAHLGRYESVLVWAFVKQFELFRDSVARKLMRSVAAVCGVSLRTRDVHALLTWASGAGLLIVERWKAIGDLRNVLAHEYVKPLSAIGALIGDAFGACEELIALRRTLLDYVDDRALLAGAADD